MPRAVYVKVPPPPAPVAPALRLQTHWTPHAAEAAQRLQRRTTIPRRAHPPDDVAPEEQAA